MDGNNFAEHLLNQAQELEQFINEDAPVIMGKNAVDFFKEGFQEEGFTDKTLEKWPEVQRRKNPKRTDRAAANRKILTGETGDLGMSIHRKDEGHGQVTIISDKPYSKIHNEGGKINMPERTTVLAFKQKKNGKTTFAKNNKKATYAQKAKVGAHVVVIPKRQFIGPSEKLNEKNLADLKRRTDGILGNENT